MRELGWTVGLGFVGLLTVLAAMDVGKFVAGVVMDWQMVLAIAILTGFPFLCGLAAGHKR